MDVKSFVRSHFGKDILSLKEDQILKERIKTERMIEKISDEIESIQEKIQKLMLGSKGKSITMKLLNIQKIKALRLESATKQGEATRYIQQLSVLLLVEAMKERQKDKSKSPLIQKILSSDIAHVNDLMLDLDVKKAFEEGRVEDVKNKLSSIFAKEDMPIDSETRELLKSIEDLEDVDEESALEMAKQKAKKISESNLKKEELE